eukprot:TRINITY_DN15565_c0_g1_i2.p1 TRINITY_DN15565_c0_g1~~TRINITY_DN15565_c0_g1_i2.p1  ORF type:complete len:269 (-),score=67.96 TRINITY_DN15565_c0_g1_i2:50-856(-)
MSPVDGLEGNEEYLNSHPAGSSSQQLQEEAAPQTQQTTSPRQQPLSATAGALLQSEPSPEAVAAWQAQALRPPPIRVSGLSTPVTPTSAAAAVGPAPRMQAGPAPRTQATPRSAPPRTSAWARPRYDGRRDDKPLDLLRSEVDLADAWAEVENARREVEQRERELDLREATVRRAEARNKATARQLSDMRLRLESYSEELEEGVLSLTAQQSSLREDRRHTADLQARARRRMYAAAAASAMREGAMQSKFRDWERWPPSAGTTAAGGW